MSSEGKVSSGFVGAFVAVLRGAFVGVLLGHVRDPDSRPGTLTTRLEFLRGHKPHVSERGPSCTTIGRCRTVEHPLPPTCRYLSELRPPARLSPWLRGSNKAPGFYFRLCVCPCVAPSLSRTVEVFIPSL